MKRHARENSTASVSDGKDKEASAVGATCRGLVAERDESAGVVCGARAECAYVRLLAPSVGRCASARFEARGRDEAGPGGRSAAGTRRNTDRAGVWRGYAEAGAD